MWPGGGRRCRRAVSPDTRGQTVSKTTQSPPRGTELAANTRKPDGGESRRDVERVILGKGTLTPTRSFRWRGEEYVAGRTRVAPDADVCRDPRAVELLEPTWDGEHRPDVIEVYESTGRRWNPRVAAALEPSPARAPARTPASSRPLYGSPEYHGSRRPRRDGDASFVGPILTQWIKR
jgi:hypothetical protein